MTHKDKIIKSFECLDPNERHLVIEELLPYCRVTDLFLICDELDKEIIRKLEKERDRGFEYGK